jgi:hypothetical protein
MKANKSAVWLLDQNGYVQRFDTKSQRIQSLTTLDPNPQSRFVKLTSTLSSLWGISCEGHLQVYVFSTHVPIREHLHTYENQRWNPLKGFCDKLLPTDRPNWSDFTGIKHLPKHDFQLPSNAWSWERDWSVQERLPNGQTLDPDGWSYAIDFSLDSHFVSKRSLLMMVRKRKWVRTQRFVGYEQWLKIDSLPDNQGFDRIVSIAVGGEQFQASIADDTIITQNEFEVFEENGINAEPLAVWILTSGGSLYFRCNVCRLRPQGTDWQKITIDFMDHNNEQLQRIAIGANGTLWALSSSGKFYVRMGVTRRQLSGEYWTIVNLPTNVHVVDLSVSSNYVWALTDRPERKILFRVGIRNNGIKKDRDLIGHGWSEIDGQIGALSAAANEQIWALDCNHTFIWVRCGITESEPVGKMWQKLDRSYLNQMQILMNESNDELACLNATTLAETTWLCVCARSCEHTFEVKKYINSNNSPWRKTIFNQLQERNKNEITPNFDCFSPVVENESYVLKSGEGKLLLEPLQQNFDERPVSLLAYAIDNTLSNTPIAKFWENASQLAGNVAEDRFTDCQLQLTKIKAGKVKSWILNLAQYKSRTWKDQLINLSDVLCVQLLPIERKIWINRLLTIHLQQSEPLRIGFASETLTEEWAHMLLSAGDKAHQLSPKILTINQKPELFVVDCAGIAYAGFDQNASNASEAIKMENVDEMRNLNLKNDKNICSLPSKLYLKSLGETHFQEIVCTSKRICWALNFCGQAYVYLFQSNDKNSSESESAMDEPEINYSQEIVDWIQIEAFENQRWFPLQGFSHNLLPTDRPKWSDRSGMQEVVLSNVKLSSRHWQWTEDWKVEIESSNCDGEGWSYALDFTTEFHRKKKITDCVRRRRWIRTARYSSKGAWKMIDESNLKLRSLSMCDYYPDQNYRQSTPVLETNSDQNATFCTNHSIDCSSSTSKSSSSYASSLIVWAISQSGDALCRVGVRSNRLEGETWLHVACSKRLQCISVASRPEIGDVSSAGTDFVLSTTPFTQAWALAEDGCVFLRHGIALSEPAGTLWLNVPSDVPSIKFVKLFAVPSGCLAITDQMQLWYRKGIQRTRPDGMRWCVLPQNPELRIQNIACTSDCSKIYANGWLPDGRPVLCMNENPTADLQQNFHLQWNVILYDSFASMCVL